MAGAVVEPGAAARAGDDLIDAFGRQRLATSRAFQRDEHAIRRRLQWPLVTQVVTERDEERVRDRHHPLMAPLAFSDKQRPFSDAHIRQTQPENLAAA